jgi:Tfp pilus assembly protein PilF
MESPVFSVGLKTLEVHRERALSAAEADRSSNLSQVDPKGAKRTNAGPERQAAATARQPPTLKEARRLRDGGDLAGAEAALKSLIRETPENVEAIVALANLYLRDLEQPQRAYPLYRRALAMDPSRASLHVNLGVYFLRTGDLPKAKEQMKRALELAPEMAEAHYNMACIQALSGNLEEARECLDRAAAIDPRCAQWAREDADLRSLHREQPALAGERQAAPE